MSGPTETYVPADDDVEDVEERLGQDVGMTGRVTVTDGEISEFFDVDEAQALACVEEAGHIAGEAAARLEGVEDGVYEITFSLRPHLVAVTDD